jgi:hypothetical protein
MVEGHVVDVGGTKSADSATRTLNDRVQTAQETRETIFFKKKAREIGKKSDQNQQSMGKQMGRREQRRWRCKHLRLGQLSEVKHRCDAAAPAQSVT